MVTEKQYKERIQNTIDVFNRIEKTFNLTKGKDFADWTNADTLYFNGLKIARLDSYDKLVIITYNKPIIDKDYKTYEPKIETYPCKKIFHRTKKDLEVFFEECCASIKAYIREYNNILPEYKKQQIEWRTNKINVDFD
mgnify:CR=1 FL=1